MKIGLLGFGTIGAGVYDLAGQNNDMEVKHVLDLREFPELGSKLVHDFSVILNDTEIDTVVEVLGGLHPAYEFVSAAIQAGKNVVTANKHLICHYFAELTALAEANGVALRCTAAVGGGIPWLTNLERAKRTNRIERISGIMNGTTNFIMDTMLHSHVTFDAALKQAQELGYAEADPSADIDGWDIQRKLIISANIAFECLLAEQDVPTFGIRNVTDKDIATFQTRNLVCKLIATGERTNNGIAAYVEPTLVHAASPEATVLSNYNLISLAGKNVGTLRFFGQGAGRYPTACNVIQDCIDITQGVKTFYTQKMQKSNVSNDNTVHAYYLRTTVKDPWLEKIHYKTLGDGILTKPISVYKMHTWAAEKKEMDSKLFFAAVPFEE